MQWIYYFQCLATTLDQTSFQEHENWRSDFVDRQHGQIECPKSIFLQTKATHFETMITTADEVNSDKTKVPEEFIFFFNITYLFGGTN